MLLECISSCSLSLPPNSLPPPSSPPRSSPPPSSPPAIFLSKFSTLHSIFLFFLFLLESSLFIYFSRHPFLPYHVYFSLPPTFSLSLPPLPPLLTYFLSILFHSLSPSLHFSLFHQHTSDHLSFYKRNGIERKLMISTDRQLAGERNSN